MAVSAGGVLMLTVGGVLAYAGFLGKNPLEAVREVASGSPSAIRSTGTDVSVSATQAAASAAAGGGLPGLPAAVAKYDGDRYSQARRWQDGYSDCSSIVGKGLKLIGVKPPGASTTYAFLASKEWTRIPDGTQLPGDVAVSTTHMVTMITATTAIGQQNTRRNVQTGSLKDLMYGSGAYVFLRYHVATAEGASGGKVN